MNIDNISVGDKFSTLNKLIKALGIKPAKGNQGKAQIKEIKRYLKYEKTHKYSRGKETNEIVITEKYDKPLDKQDGRSAKSSDYIDALAPILQYTDGRYTTSMLMQKIGMIDDKDLMSTINEYDNAVKSYKCLLKNEFKRKVISTLNYLEKNDKITSWRLAYFLKEYENEDFYDFHIANKKETELINHIMQEEKDNIASDYETSWDKLKYDTDIYQEYLDNVNEKIEEKMGFIGCINGFYIKCKDQIFGDDDDKLDEFVSEFMNNDISPVMELFDERMEHLIDITGYDRNSYLRKQNRDNLQFGKGLHMFDTVDFVYTLQNQEVYSFHKLIFGHIPFQSK